MHEEASDYEGEFGKLMKMPPCVSFNTFVDVSVCILFLLLGFSDCFLLIVCLVDCFRT